MDEHRNIAMREDLDRSLSRTIAEMPWRPLEATAIRSQPFDSHDHIQSIRQVYPGWRTNSARKTVETQLLIACDWNFAALCLDRVEKEQPVLS
jgi:hypothetical protein